MSTDDPTNRGKTLSPEFLPAPAAGEPLGPRERVAERARLLLQRLRGLGPAAGAAVLSLQCTGYGVVDPLPPPPMQCSSSPTPFGDNLHANAMFATGTAAPQLLLTLRGGYYPPGNYVGYGISAVHVTGGTLINIQDMTTTGQGGGTDFLVTIVPADATTMEIFADVDFTCGAAAATKHYRITYLAPAGPNTDVTVVEITASDAGTDAATDAGTD